MHFKPTAKPTLTWGSRETRIQQIKIVAYIINYHPLVTPLTKSRYLVTCEERQFRYCFSESQKITLKNVALYHAGVEGYISITNMSENVVKYAFGDQNVLFEVPAGDTENVECNKKMKVTLYADNSEYCIVETSKFRLLSSTVEFANAH